MTTKKICMMTFGKELGCLPNNISHEEYLRIFLSIPSVKNEPFPKGVVNDNVYFACLLWKEALKVLIFHNHQTFEYGPDNTSFEDLVNLIKMVLEGWMSNKAYLCNFYGKKVYENKLEAPIYITDDCHKKIFRAVLLKPEHERDIL